MVSNMLFSWVFLCIAGSVYGKATLNTTNTLLKTSLLSRQLESNGQHCDIQCAEGCNAYGLLGHCGSGSLDYCLCSPPPPKPPQTTPKPQEKPYCEWCGEGCTLKNGMIGGLCYVQGGDGHCYCSGGNEKCDNSICNKTCQRVGLVGGSCANKDVCECNNGQ